MTANIPSKLESEIINLRLNVFFFRLVSSCYWSDIPCHSVAPIEPPYLLLGKGAALEYNGGKSSGGKSSGSILDGSRPAASMLWSSSCPTSLFSSNRTAWWLFQGKLNK